VIRAEHGARRALVPAVLGLCPTLACAGVWTIEPKLSVTAEYATNPDLLVTNPQSQSVQALMLDVPTTYTADSNSFALLPRVRVGNASTYASYNSNYWYLDAVAAMNHERFQGNITAGASADSTLHSALEATQIGRPNTRRDGRQAGATGNYSLDERTTVSASVDWLRALYPPDSGLDSFDYTSGSASAQYASTERLTLSASVGIGFFHDQNGQVTSTTDNYTVGLKYKLRPVWALSASVGEARLSETYYFPSGSIKVPGSGTIYSVTLARQGERSNLSAGANRSVQPTGFGVLAVQTAASVAESYQASERWTWSGSVQWLQSREPLQPTVSTLRTRLDGELDVTWHWRPVWDVTLRVVYTEFRYQVQLLNQHANSTGGYLLLTRIFGQRRVW
jgi:hypothetical protein